MKAVNRLYFIAYSLTILVIIAGQLIWLPAPLFKATNTEWIAVIDWLYYVLLLIPLSFIIATHGIVVCMHRQKKIRIKQLGLPSLIYISAIYTMYNIFLHNYVQAIIGLIVLALLAAILYVIYRVRLSLMSTKKLTLLSVSYIVCMLITICPIRYNVIHPFFSFNMQSYAHLTAIKDVPIQEEKVKEAGKVDGVLVVDRPAFIIDLLYAKLFKHIELVKHTKEQMPIIDIYSQVVSQKLSSNQLAGAYAWQLHSGEQVIEPKGVRIVGILEQSTVLGHLHAGDIIVKVENKPVHTIADLSDVMSVLSVNENINVTVDTNGQTKQIQVKTKASQENDKKAVLGIYIEQAVTIKQPLSVTYQAYTAHFGGPSHGAMLTIAILDQLQNGQLLSNKYIAGTGTIEIDGSIGMVGGIKQKAYAVSRSEAEVFFVPEQAVELAKQGAPELNIVGVKHINDIIKWLTND